MGYNFTTKDGVVIAKLLQFVATDEQVNTAITNYLHKNGISLAEGIDLVKMNTNVGKNTSEISGLKETISDLQKAQTNILLEYKDHFFVSWEKGYINDTTGKDTGDTGSDINGHYASGRGRYFAVKTLEKLFQNKRYTGNYGHCERCRVRQSKRVGSWSR